MTNHPKNITEPYNQGMKVQVTTKRIKKTRQTLNEISTTRDNAC